MLDYIIVGLGLSGAALARRLEKAEKSFLVLNDNSQKASRVAGGLMNPVILKRFTLAWDADPQMQKALNFYADLESFLDADFLKPLEIYRRFSSVEEQNEWFSASDKPGLDKYLNTKLNSNINSNISGAYSFGKLEGTYRLETGKMLELYAAHLQKKGLLNHDTFDHDAVKFTSGGVEYKRITAKNIIFCEGFGLHKNPYFNYLPLKGNKGEYIFIEAPDLDLQVAVKSSVFIIPVGEDIYMVGATYNNNDKSPEPTEAAKTELVKKLKEFVKVEFEVVDQVAGLRPTTIDRRPLAGQHPERENLYCCNGFGSRGILLSPTISEDLMEYIENGTALPPEVDLARFTRKWFPKN